MKKLIIFTFHFSLFIFLVSCEKEIEISLEDQQQKVVVQSSTNSVDQPVSLTLTYSRPIFGDHYYNTYEYYGFPTIDNADVTLEIDGGAALTAMREGNTYTFAHIPQAGERLDLRVSVPGGATVTSTATVPQKPDVTSVSIDVDNTDEYYGYSTLHLRFTLNDHAAEGNYYSVRIKEIDTIIHTYHNGETIVHDTIPSEGYQYFSCTDYMLVSSNNIDDMFDQFEDPEALNTYHGTEFLFSDANINGQHHTLELQVDNIELPYIYNGDDGLWETFFSYTLEVTALTKDLYLYRKTINSSGDDLMEIIGEPVQIHGNIDGGIGIFGVSNKYLWKMKIDN